MLGYWLAHARMGGMQQQALHKKGARTRRFPLHIHISALFTFLLLSSGVLLGLFNYQQTSDIILSSSNQLFSQMRQEVKADLRNTYQPINAMINLLARNEQVNGRDRHARMVMLPIFAQALRDNPKLASIYIGYGNGDFFMLRPLRSQKLRDIFHAPP